MRHSTRTDLQAPSAICMLMLLVSSCRSFCIARAVGKGLAVSEDQTCEEQPLTTLPWAESCRGSWNWTLFWVWGRYAWPHWYSEGSRLYWDVTWRIRQHKALWWHFKKRNLIFLGVAISTLNISLSITLTETKALVLKTLMEVKQW